MNRKVSFFFKRIAYFVPTLLGLLILVFFVSRVIPGDPAALVAGETATAEQVKAIRTQLGFDQPLYVQFGVYVRQLVTGDLGKSLYSGRKVSQDLFERFPATLELTLAAMFISVLVGIPLGILSALKRNSLLDHLVRGFTVSGLAIASFWLGIMLQLFASMWLGHHASWQPYRSSRAQVDHRSLRPGFGPDAQRSRPAQFVKTPLASGPHPLLCLPGHPGALHSVRSSRCDPEGFYPVRTGDGVSTQDHCV